MKNILMSKRKIKLFGYIAFFAFSFAWITCNSHTDFFSPVSSPITHHEESSAMYNESCIDHTQVFSRNQGIDYHSDFSYVLTTTNYLDFSSNKTWQGVNSLHVAEVDTEQRLFIQNKVLRI